VTLEILAVTGIGEVSAGSDLAALIAAHAPPLLDGDVLVVTSKIVSKAEGRVVSVDREAAITSETVRVVATRGETQIVQTRHGFVMAAAGVDASNVSQGQVVLLPVDSDASAARLRAGLFSLLGVSVGVVVSDTFGRPWRVGVTDIAVGVAGFSALDDLRGQVDSYGNDLQMTVTCIADEIAAAGDLVKGKLSGVPVAIVRGLSLQFGDFGGIRPVVRGADDDMFSLGTRDVLSARVDAVSFGAGPVSSAAIPRAIAAAGLAAAPGISLDIEFLVVEAIPSSVGSLFGDVAASASMLVVPWLRHSSTRTPSPRELLAAGAAIENVLVALAIEQLGSLWVLPEHHVPMETFGLDDDAWPIGVIAVGPRP
jgi:coenzyme F420-0:L-glutamate ligase / coenzyme F420-1:gamma-L-glutamate ligase